MLPAPLGTRGFERLDPLGPGQARTRRDRPCAVRPAVTLVELLVVIAIIGVLILLLLPAIQSARETARAASCQNRLRQLVTAALNYESTHSSLPPTLINGVEWGQHARLLPFLEEHALWDTVQSQMEAGNASFTGPQVAVSTFLCPSNPGEGVAGLAGGSNYRGNAGTRIGVVERQSTSRGRPPEYSEQNNGGFVAGEAVLLRQFVRGLSKVALFSEMIRGDGDPQLLSEPGDWLRINGAPSSTDDLFVQCAGLKTSDDGQFSGPFSQSSIAGRDWASGHYTATRYNHVMPPNARSCVRGGGRGSLDGPDRVSPVALNGAATTASSRHRNGVYAAFGDGSVRFVSEEISVAVWREMGRREEMAEVRLPSRR